MPEVEKVTLARRFIDLVQGESSVTDYVASFESLSKYGVEYINTLLKNNQRFVYGLNKNLKKSLLLKLEVSFDQLIDIALRLEKAYKESDVEVGSAKPNSNNNKKRHPFIRFESPNPSKRAKQETSIAKTPIPNRGECYNCGSKNHYINRCPRPISCRYCKSADHYISLCPKRQSRREGKLQAPSNSSLSQGTFHSIIDGIVLFRDLLI